MAKEMQIIFVYDLEQNKTEQDDPLLSILYFTPGWVSESQKMALCGQLMGLLAFCCEFSFPNLISLQNGKFKIEKFGRFVLVIGSDRNISESLLTQRASLIVSMLKLYHQSLEQLFTQFQQDKQFSEKLYHIFETYLPVLQHENPLQKVYKLFLPKSASTLYLDAIQILEHVFACRQGLYGGLILHHNKVLASNLSVDLTKILTATVGISSAEVEKNINFHVPVHVLILKVYIKLSEYNRLQKQIKKVSESTSLGIQNSLPLPFSIKKKPKELKRDKSLIFSNIPEEEALIEIPSPEKARNRPCHLPLKFKTLQKDLPESGIMSFDESDSFADFIGRTTVAGTPMTENKILTGPIPSIFASAQEEVQIVENSKKATKGLEQIFINFVSNPFKDAQWKKSVCELNKLSDLDETGRYNTNIPITDPTFPITPTDPTFPFFNQKGQPFSKSLFDDYQNLHINTDFFKSPGKKLKSEPQKANEEEKKFESDTFTIKKPTDNKNSPAKALRNQKKKMMRLPIKSFSLETDSGKPSTSTSASTSIFDSPSTKTKKYTGSLQLTPLMSKLTLLAMSENEAFSNFDIPTTPTPVDNTNRSVFNRLSKVEEESTYESVIIDEELKKCDLFVCSQQNMTLMVIGEEGLMRSDQQIIQSLFDICVNKLSRLELKLNEIINVTVDLKASDYSYINLDKSWDVLKRGGVWQQNDLQSLLMMHDIFRNKNITDIIVKSNESVVTYGHSGTGDTEIYYQHASQKQSSGVLPAPSDFTVISQAKRRLERDHSLVLF